MNRRVKGVYEMEMDKGYCKAIHLFGDSSSDYSFDPDQSKLIIELPDPPAKKEIWGHNLATSSQKFTREKPPVEYYELMRKHSGKRDDIYRDIWNNTTKYTRLIKYIEQEWDRRINGFWFYNNGFPVYMTGTHYFYSRWWNIDIGLPDFRDRDWLSYQFWDNLVVKDPFCLGEIYMKHRREGATNRAACKQYEYISRTMNAFGGIQSKTESDAKKVFKQHLVYGWKRLPFFHRPIYDGNSDPASILRFIEPGLRGKGADVTSDEQNYLGGFIDYANSKPDAYDSQKKHRMHLDEAGKTTESDVKKTWRILKTCLTTGAAGKATVTSTVAEMVKGGGRNFKYLWDGSDYGKRDANNKTSTGLYRFFLPATIGLELENVTFINEYGVSDVEKANEYLDNVLAHLKSEGDTLGMSEQRRQYPRTVREAFRSGMANDYFDTEGINKRLEIYTFENRDIQRGYFEWNDITDWRKGARFIQDPKRDKFHISWMPKKEQRNRIDLHQGFPVPGHKGTGMCGGDPFKYNDTQGTRKSKAGFTAKRYYDPLIDPPDKPVEERETGQFVCDYLWRPPTKDESVEDMLMACVFYGWPIFPEIDVDAIWDYFIKKGAVGYLYFSRDERNRLRNTPGANTRDSLKEKMFQEYGKFFKLYASTCKHHRLLEQANEVSYDLITDYDLFTAGGYNLIGEAHDMRRLKPQTEKTVDERQREIQENMRKSFPFKKILYKADGTAVTKNLGE